MEDKYKGSMEQVGKAVLRFSSNSVFDLIKLFEIVLFSYITGNADMHLKNFSILHDENDMIKLAPVYDLISTRLIIPERDDPDESALAINGKRAKLKLSDFISFAQFSGMNAKQIDNTLKRFKHSLPAALAFVKQGMISDDKKEELTDLISTRASVIEGFSLDNTVPLRQ